MTNPGDQDVLIVEDNPDLVELMRLVLDGAGYPTRVAYDGQEALAAARSRRPGLVLLDMLMPVMNGWDCARELRASYGEDLPIVVVTAAEHASARAAEVSADAALAKPFDMGDLLRLVHRFLGDRRASG